MKFKFTKSLIVAGLFACGGLLMLWSPVPTATAGAPMSTTAASANALSGLQVVESSPVSIPSGSSASAKANCPSGMKVIGTGFYNSITDVAFVKTYTYFASGFFFNNSSITVDVHVQAICSTNTSGLTSLSVSDANREFERDVRQIMDQMASQKLNSK